MTYYLIKRKQFYDIARHNPKMKDVFFITEHINPSIESAFDDFLLNGLKSTEEWLRSFDEFIEDNEVLLTFKHEMTFLEFQELYPEHLV